MELQEILKLVDKVIDLEAKIEEAVKAERDAKKRKKIREAVAARDRDKLHDLLFD